MSNFPQHIAIIMDGNGRWAKARRKPRIFGHQTGVKTVRRIVEDASEIGIKCLTLYSFSTENWSRPKAEIKALFNLLKAYVQDDLETLHARGVCVKIIGSRKGLSQDLLDVINKVETTTHANINFNLNIAFNYGGRDEILRAVNKAVLDGNFKDVGQAGIDTIDPNILEPYLDTAGLPEVDLVIRTSGEKRISNFLLWQAAYAEFVFMDVLWPDFSKEDLWFAINMFKARERRFGNIDATSKPLKTAPSDVTFKEAQKVPLNTSQDKISKTVV